MHKNLGYLKALLLFTPSIVSIVGIWALTESRETKEMKLRSFHRRIAVYDVAMSIRGFCGNGPPPRNVSDANGMPLYSWRVLLQAERDPTFRKNYDFASPWNDPRNLKVAAETMQMFTIPENSRPQTSTHFAIWSEESVWTEGITNLNRISFVEVESSNVHWTEPWDLDLEGLVSTIEGRNERVTLYDGSQVTFGMTDGDFLTISKERIPMIVFLVKGR